jgi:hypothetical protein
VRRQEAWADREMAYSDLYKARFVASISLLRQVKILTEDENGFTLRKLVSGSDKYDMLINLTKMSEHRTLREVVRVKRFFENPDAAQRMLWHIIGED